jgi:hypothetical protein
LVHSGMENCWVDLGAEPPEFSFLVRRLVPSEAPISQLV